MFRTWGPLSNTSVNLSSPQVRKRSLGRRILGWVFFIAVGLVALSSIVDPDKSSKPSCGEEGMAFIMSQHFIKKRLRAPATASFPWSSDDYVKVVRLGDCEFRVRAYVGAQNAFGANVRTKYSMNLTYRESDETWSASNIWMDP